MTETGKTVAGAVAMTVVLAAAAGLALWQGGDDPARRQAVGLGGLGGWLVGRWSRGRPAAVAVAGSLGATLVRLTPSLAALVWVATTRGPVRAAGAATLVVVFYLAVLATEVLATMILSRKG
jgi:hypothetical protein